MSSSFEPDRPAHADALCRMDRDVVAWLTTVAPDGTPQTSVICFLWDGETILVYSEPDKPKMRNISANPRVGFNLNCDEYGDHWVAIEGTAAVDESVSPSDRNDAWMAKHAEPYRHWGMDPHETAATWSAALRITPTKVRVW
jgi:PPOX class probable F420-dependent enzyme